MTSNLRTDLAQHIRTVDPDNELDAEYLGQQIAERIGVTHIDVNDVINHVAEIDYDKSMSPSELADDVVDHFNLDTFHLDEEA